MRTPAITIFVVCILVMGLGLAFYDYKKHGARVQGTDISRSEADTLKETRLSGDEQVYLEDYKKAIAEYKRALRISPRDAYLRNDLGTAYYHMGLKMMDPALPEDDFGFGTEVDARHLEGAEAFDKMKEALAKTKSGIITTVVKDETVKRAIEVHVREQKHFAHIEEEETEEGAKEYWISIITGPTGEAFLNAEREYKEAMSIKSVKDKEGRKYSNYSTASRNLGTLYFRMGKKKDAITQWRRALQLEPTDGELRNLLGKYE